MKDRISALMDGELDERAAEEILSQLGADPAGRETWRTYHLIGDAIRARGMNASRPRFLAKPARQRVALALAASLAAVALVGWLAFAPQPEAPSPVAQAPKAPALVPLPVEANDYLLAHQGFSPRASFLGMAPYVRTVADHREETGK